MNIFFKTLLIVCFFSSSWAQVMPEYVNSANAWDTKNKKSVPLTPEEGLNSFKFSAANFVPMGGLFAKNKAMVKIKGAKSASRVAYNDTLKIIAQIDPSVNPAGLFKIFKATVKSDKREFTGMTQSLTKGVDRSDGDYKYTIDKISHGFFLISVLGTNHSDELFFYIGTHEKQMASLTLGID